MKECKNCMNLKNGSIVELDKKGLCIFCGRTVGTPVIDTIEDKFKKLGKYDITLRQWQDEWGYWRLGLDWIDEFNYEYICEKPTIEECLDSAIEYLKINKVK